MREGYTKKARFSGPFDYARVLVDGSNDYAGQVMQIINDSPHEDLPLILATLSVIVEDLTSTGEHVTKAYVGFLVDLLRRNTHTEIIKAVVPAEDDDGN